MSWNFTRFTPSQCEDVAKNPTKYDVGDLRQAAKCAALHYENDDYGCDVEWMTKIMLECNAELRRRGEREV